jgi:lysozyme
MDKLKTSKSGKDIIKYYEGLHDGDLKKIGLQPKMCPAGIWTVGYGYALVNKNTGKWLKGNADYPLIEVQYPDYMNMTEVQAEKLLEYSLLKYENKVNKKLTLTVSQNMYDALVSHTYNTGGSDTLFRLVNEGKTQAAADWIRTRYTTAEGVVMPGLVLRRKSEAILFLKP